MAENPGAKNRQLVLQQPDLTPGSAGQPSGKFIDVATVWVRWAGQTGMGSIRSTAGQTGNQAMPVRYSARIRYRPAAKKGWRLQSTDGTTYYVTQVRHDLAGREWTDLIVETEAVGEYA